MKISSIKKMFDGIYGAQNTLMRRVFRKLWRSYRQYRSFMGLMAHIPLFIRVQRAIRQHRDIGHVIALVMTHENQQQYFVDFYEHSLRAGKKYYFVIVNDYYLGPALKLDVFSGIPSLVPQMYRWISGVSLALHAEISCRSWNVPNICYVGHGFPGKHTLWSDANLQSFNHYFLYGPRDREILKFLVGNNRNRLQHITLWNVGYPKYDAQIKDVYDTSEVRAEIGLRPGTGPVVLFAPAWDPGGALRKYGSKLFELFGEMIDVDFIVKLHPVSLINSGSPDYDFYTGGVDWSATILQACEKYHNLHFVRSGSINPLFKVSDILLTDFSGVALGYFLEDKPVICIDCPEYYSEVLPQWGEDGALSRDNSLFNNGRSASHIVYNLDELADAVDLATKCPSLMSQRRRSIAASLLYNPGRGTDAMLDAVDSILGH